MRKDVKRARLWLINQLSQKVKRLTAKKVLNDQQKAKNVRKTDRHLEEIKVLKHIDVDDVSKYALCHVLKLNQNNLESLDVEQRAMLRLATHKFIQNQVTKFRESHPIAIDKLVLLIRSLGLQYQKKKNQTNEEEEENADKKIKPGKRRHIPDETDSKNLEEQPPKTKKKKSESEGAGSKNHTLTEDDEAVLNESSEETYTHKNEHSEENDDSENKKELDDENDYSEDEDKLDEVNDGSEDELDEENNSSESELPEKSSTSKTETVKATKIIETVTEAMEPTKSGRSMKEEPKSETKKVKPDKKVSKIEETAAKTKKDLVSKKKIAWPEVKNPSIDKREGAMVIKRLNLDKLQDSAELTFDEPEDSFFVHKKGSEVPRSSFFVGGVDEVEVEPVKDNPKSNTHSSQRWNSNESYGNSKPQHDRFNKKINNNNKYNSDKSKDIKTAKPGKFFVKLYQKEFIVIFHIVSDKTEVVDTNLHPAWIAKKNLQKAQKLEINLNSGQGKKITFDD